MPESLGRAVLALETDASGLSRGLDQAEQKTSGWLGRISGSFKRLSSSSLGGALLQGIGLGAGLSAFQMLGSAIRGAIDYMGDAIGLASDLNEEISKSEVVFGSHADELQAWADTTADSIGLTKQEALGAAGAFGNMFNTIGIAKGASADMSRTMVQLASDMASFQNEDPTEMLDRIRSGLAGEAEPLRRFGVLLSEAAVAEFAYKNGIAERGTALTEAQKVQARYGLILEQTAIQQGDFARTADESANKQRRLDARMEELQTRIGKGLLPVFELFQGVMLNVVLPVVDAVVSAFGLLGDVVSAVVDGIGGVIGNFALDFGEQGDRIHGIADRFGASFQDVKDEVQQYMDETGATVEEALTHVEGRFYEASNEIPERMEEGMRATHQVVVDRGAEIAAAWDGIAEHPAKSIRDHWDDVRAAAYQTAVEHAKGLLDAQNEPKVAMDALIQIQEEALTRGEEIARLKGQLTALELSGGLDDERESVRAAARAAALAIQNRLKDLGADAYQWGSDIPTQLAAGMYANQWKVTDSVYGSTAALARGIRGFMPGSEPRNPQSGLRGITKAFGFVDTLAGAILGDVSKLDRPMQRLTQALMPQFTVPSFAGRGQVRSLREASSRWSSSSTCSRSTARSARWIPSARRSMSLRSSGRRGDEHPDRRARR